MGIGGITPRQRAAIGEAAVTVAAEIYQKTYRLDLFCGDKNRFYACAAVLCDMAHYWRNATGQPDFSGQIIDGMASLAKEWYRGDLEEGEHAG